jgi:non-canonical purine NTP pyrophosphatase (RdgB/HAM1 family)
MNKLKEAREILGKKFDIENIDIDVPEIQSTDVKEVTKSKIEAAYNEAVKIYGPNVNIICEDTGLHFKNMNNFPGALIKFYHKALGNVGISKHNGGSKATAITVVGLRNKKGVYLFSGETKGKVVKPKYLNEKGGFGWDPLFIPKYPKEFEKYKGKSYGEIPNEVKNSISQRYKAFKKLIQKFKIEK